MKVISPRLPHVVLIADSERGADVLTFVSRYLKVRTYSLDGLEQVRLANALFVVLDINLQQPKRFRDIRWFMERVNAAGISSIFVLDENTRQAVVQLCALGGSEYVVRPLSYAKFKPIFDVHANEAIERHWATLPAKVGTALKQSLSAFNGMMTSAAEGKPLDTAEIEDSCKHIVETAATDSLRELIRALEGHHNRTFYHVLRTCGYAVGFAHAIGIGGRDLQNVAVAGLMHDIGKSRIPSRILESPMPLSRAEFAVMRRHPMLGRDAMLAGDGGWDKDVLDVVVHHHEKIDGTGYPDGQKGSEIGNLTLLVSIADVFAALTEERAYKRALTGEEAFQVMASMDDKIDQSMLRAFEPVILQKIAVAA